MSISKKGIAILALSAPVAARACVTCNKALRDALVQSASDYLPQLLLTFGVVGAVVLVLARMALRANHFAGASGRRRAAPLFAAAAVAGIGLGGFADGIILHQMLQWHEMLSARIPPATLVAKSVNMFWDGVFHLVCLLVTMLGLWLI